jgi:molybdate transport system substrate-binding protein
MCTPCYRIGASLLLLALLIAAGGCGGTTVTEATETLTVAAAADVTYAFTEIGALFEAETGYRVRFHFGSTGQLAQQIEQGAPVDLFAAANQAAIEELERLGLILPDTKRLYARGQLIVWTRADSPLVLTDIADLRQPDVRRIAIANPDHAPYGVAAREALQNAGLWEGLLPKLVLAENVRQAFEYAANGDVDAAIIALSFGTPTATARIQPGRWVLIPQALYTPIDQALAVIKDTRHEQAARALADFISGPTGRTVLRRYGFLLPDEAPRP